MSRRRCPASSFMRISPEKPPASAALVSPRSHVDQAHTGRQHAGTVEPQYPGDGIDTSPGNILIKEVVKMEPPRAAYYAYQTLILRDGINVPGKVDENCIDKDKLADDLETAISDLVADLQHLADHQGINWEDVLDRANNHFIEEKAEAATDYV